MIDHIVVVDANGQAYSWGSAASGQLGDGTVTEKSSPVLVIGSHSFISVSNGSSVSCALKIDGSAWAWGDSTYGKLGDNSLTDKSSPVQVVGGHSFVNLFGCGHMMVGLKSNGQVWTWGNNTYGVLGNNSTTNKSSPVLVVGNHSFVQIAPSTSAPAGVGIEVVSALKYGGEVWTWGSGTSGQLGNGATDSKSSPVLVTGSHSFVMLPIGGKGVKGALKADGSAWMWGVGTSGEMGDNTTSNKSSPVRVVGGHSFISMALGSSTVYGLKENGEIWSWGSAYGGQLGDNTETAKSSPVLVVGSHSFIAVTASGYSAYGLKSNGEVWAWGYNFSGQLGDNTETDRSSPVLVITTGTL